MVFLANADGALDGVSDEASDLTGFLEGEELNGAVVLSVSGDGDEAGAIGDVSVGIGEESVVSAIGVPD